MLGLDQSFPKEILDVELESWVPKDGLGDVGNKQEMEVKPGRDLLLSNFVHYFYLLLISIYYVFISKHYLFISL